MASAPIQTRDDSSRSIASYVAIHSVLLHRDETTVILHRITIDVISFAVSNSRKKNHLEHYFVPSISFLSV